MQVRVHGRTPTLDRHDGTKGKKIDHISIYSCNDIFKPSTCYFDPIVSKENY